MPWRLLLGAGILGYKAVEEQSIKQMHREIDEAMKKRDQDQTRIIKEASACIPQEMRDIYHEYMRTLLYENKEIPNVFVQGGTLYYCQDACDVQDTVIAARNNKHSMIDPQPRWRLARVRDFTSESRWGTGGLAIAALMWTRFHYLSNDMEMTDEQWEQLQFITKRFKYVYPHAITGYKPMPEW